MHATTTFNAAHYFSTQPSSPWDFVVSPVSPLDRLVAACEDLRGAFLSYKEAWQ